MNVKSSYRYEGFCAQGEGILCKSDMSFWNGSPKLTDPRGVTFEIEEGVTEVEEGFFDMFPTLVRLDLPGSIKSLPLSDKSREIFRRNGVVISGEFDSFAESFAREQGLSFIHSDIELARAGNYFEHGADIVTLRFRNGTPQLRQESFCQGSSAGSSGGGEETVPLRSDFYKTLSQNDIADMCRGSCYKKVKENPKLAKFLKLARKKDGFWFSFSKPEVKG